jgi:hypothetical protein
MTRQSMSLTQGKNSPLWKRGTQGGNFCQRLKIPLNPPFFKGGLSKAFLIFLILTCKMRRVGLMESHGIRYAIAPVFKRFNGSSSF